MTGHIERYSMHLKPPKPDSRLSLRDNDTDRSKLPRLKEWYSVATTDEETICEWSEQFPKAGYGALLGHRSSIIDIEFDNEEGRATADRLLSGIITPTYRSGSRSIHRLFKYTPDLPPVSVLKIQGLELRIGGNEKNIFSVLPPAIHPKTKEEYAWLEG